MTFWLGTDDQAATSCRRFSTPAHLDLRRGAGDRSLRAARHDAGTGSVTSGALDALLMRIADIQLSFPAILIALVLLAVLGQGVGQDHHRADRGAVGYYARTVARGGAAERNREYMQAAAVPAAAGCGASCCATCAELPAAAHRGGDGAGRLCHPRWKRRCRFSAWACRSRSPRWTADRQRLQLHAVRQILGELLSGVALVLTIVSSIWSATVRDVLNPRLQK